GCSRDYPKYTVRGNNKRCNHSVRHTNGQWLHSPSLEVSSAMRTCTHGSGSARKVVAIEVKGSRMRMLQRGSDGTMKRSEKDLNSESDARAACEKMARELVARGFL